jgi:hypothetical protein
MSYVSNCESILRKKARNCFASEQKKKKKKKKNDAQVRAMRDRGRRENTCHCPSVFTDAFDVLLAQKVVPQLRVLFRPPVIDLDEVVPAVVWRAERTPLETVWKQQAPESYRKLETETPLALSPRKLERVEIHAAEVDRV